MCERSEQVGFTPRLFCEGFCTEKREIQTIVEKGSYQKLYLPALRSKLAKAEDKVFNSGNEYKNNKAKPCRAGKMGDGILPAKVRNGQGG